MAFVIQNAERMRRITLLSVACPILPFFLYVFLTVHHDLTIY